MIWWAIAILALCALALGALLWSTLRVASLADDGSEQIMANLSRTGRDLSVPHRVHRQRPHWDADFDVEALWAKHSAIWEKEYEAGVR